MDTPTIDTNDQNFHILERRPDGVLNSFIGTLEEALAECDRRNVTDEQGTTYVLESFENEQQMELEFRRMDEIEIVKKIT